MQRSIAFAFIHADQRLEPVRIDRLRQLENRIAARETKQLRRLRRLRQRANQGVLAPSFSYHDDFHRRACRESRAGAQACRAPGPTPQQSDQHGAGGFRQAAGKTAPAGRQAESPEGGASPIRGPIDPPIHHRATARSRFTPASPVRPTLIVPARPTAKFHPDHGLRHFHSHPEERRRLRRRVDVALDRVVSGFQRSRRHPRTQGERSGFINPVNPAAARKDTRP